VSNDVKARVGELVGEASMCWEPIPSGTYQSDRAAKIVDRILQVVDDNGRFARTVAKMSGTELVRLETSVGGYVETVRMPRFDPPAQVLVWGLRTFTYYDFYSPDEGPDAIRVYRECMAYVVPMQPGLQGGG
jgi:hypothetical protein